MKADPEADPGRSVAAKGAHASWPWERRRFVRPMIVAGLGVVSIGLLIATNSIRERPMRQDTALHRAVGEVQTRLSAAHLWLEEYVSGDRVDVGEIFANLDRAERLVMAISLGGSVSGVYRLKAVTDPETRRRIDEISLQLRRFRRMAEEREAGYRAGEDVGIGSTIDREFDRIFRLLLNHLREFDTLVEQQLADAHRRSALLFRVILFSWIVIVALAVSGLTRLEIRGRRSEQWLLESESQLRQAQKMEAVGRLAGGMAHDINNYLAAISAQCELVMMSAEIDSEVYRRMDTVVSTTTKAATLMERLLAFSRRQPAAPEVVQLNRVVVDLSKLLDRLMGVDIRLTTSLAEDLWNVEIDPSQMEQVLLNLVVNAREAMPEGGQLKIATANRVIVDPLVEGIPVARRGDYVVLSVTDTGTGVLEEVRDKLFEPFVTTKDKASQSGLGLSMVYSIVRQSGGGVAVSSGAGAGAVFSVYLPRSRALLKVAAEETTTEMDRGRGQRLLLVEDNIELRDAVAESLVDLGYRVSVSASAEEALELDATASERFELLITDVVMPGLNGYQLWERLKSRHAELEVVFISGHTDDVMLRHGVQEGEFHFLHKPFAIRDLATTLAELLAPDPEAPELDDRASGVP